MTNVITTVGWFGFLVALVYFVVNDRSGAGTGYISHTRDMLIVSASLVLTGYVLKYLGTVFRIGYGRCKKCGKKIEKQEMYCYNHSIEAIHDAQDLARKTERRK